MSKKKTLSTMSLKDFHGGSIPSDLPLPSAPGVVVRSGSDRTMSVNLGNNLMRSDLRPRPKSSGATHNFDEKASFLSHPAPIGRNFDEDERKPLDGLSAPRRTISDESIRNSAPVRQDVKPSYAASMMDRPVSSPLPQSPSLGPVSSPVKSGGGPSFTVSSEGNEVQVVKNCKVISSNSGPGVNINPPNAWGVRKDVMGICEAGNSSLSSGLNSVSKFAQASAIDKVSSGMWQSKNANNLLPHLIYSKGNIGIDIVGDRGDYGSPNGVPAEIDQIAEDVNQNGEREWLSHGQVQTQIYTQDMQTGGTSGGSQLHPTSSSESSERPQMKFLPRSKPLERLENDYRQGFQQATEAGCVNNAIDLHGNANVSNPGLTDAKTGNQLVDRVIERPKLNLKPRSQPLEHSDGSSGGKRNSLFGGARPRELVLKERGADDVAINNLDLNQSPSRASSARKEVTSEQLIPTARNNQKFENRSFNKRQGKDPERKDQRMDQEKAETERRNWRNDKWKNNKDTKDQRPEPETWRKPVEEQKPASTDASGFRQGKLVSAVDLAQVFSKSVSDRKSPDLHPSPTLRTLPGHNNQLPFSRLTAPTAVHRG